MVAKLDYRWHLRQVMATRGMFATTDLLAPLADRGIALSSSQVYRLVVERPERLSLKILMALLDILGCTMEDLIEPVAVARPAKKTRAAGADAGVGALPAGGDAEQAAGRVADLPNLLCPRPRRRLRPVRHRAGTSGARRPGPAVVPVLFGQRPGQSRGMRPLRPPATGEHSHSRGADLRHLQPSGHLDLFGLRAKAALHGLQDHRPALVRRVRPVVGAVLAMRRAGPGPCRNTRPAAVRRLRRPRHRILEDLSGLRHPWRLIAGACRRCHLHGQLQELLCDPATGRIRTELQALHQAFAGVERPQTALGWLRRSRVRVLLTELAGGQRPLTHAALDELPASKILTHSRSVLVATGSLPDRDEHLAQLERWATQTVAARSDPDERQLLHRYAVWHVLRWLRHRTRSTPATHNQAAVARLPEPLATLVRHLAATRRGHATIGDQGTSPWLLPGGRPGQPISPDRLSERLHRIGIHPGPARSTALFQLATELPAAILARMLGIHISVAVAWQHATAGDWMTYVADISHRIARTPTDDLDKRTGDHPYHRDPGCREVDNRAAAGRAAASLGARAR